MAISELDKALASITQRVSDQLALTVVDRVVLPQKMLSVSEANAKHDKFGLVVLEDNSAGFFYRLLDVKPGMRDHYRQQAERFRGRPVSDCLNALDSNDLFERGLALGVINAATDALFKKTGYNPPVKNSQRKDKLDRSVEDTAPAGTDIMTVKPTLTRHQKSIDPVASPGSEFSEKFKPQNPTNTRSASSRKIGMIGYFSVQAKRLQAQGHQVAVLEMNRELALEEDGLTVSHHPHVLQNCETIYCTASTLINNTLDGLLQEHTSRSQFELVGPSAGCFPDPLFERGTYLIGGSRVVDIESAEVCVYHGQPWQQSVAKFSMLRRDYPGSLQLLNRL